MNFRSTYTSNDKAHTKLKPTICHINYRVNTESISLKEYYLQPAQKKQKFLNCL
jgi:hypothetical protein